MCIILKHKMSYLRIIFSSGVRNVNLRLFLGPPFDNSSSELFRSSVKLSTSQTVDVTTDPYGQDGCPVIIIVLGFSNDILL